MPVFKSANDAVDWLIEYVRTKGIEGLFHRYYGVYPGKVTSNSDADGKGRIFCILPVTGSSKEYPIWIRSAVSGGSRGGFVSVPEADDLVWVIFENGDLSKPVYIGAQPKNGAYYPGLSGVEKRGIQTPKGHIFRIDDGNDTITLEHTSGARVQIAGDGSVSVVPAPGKEISLGEGVLSALVRADTFKTLFNAHTHTTVSVGSPTSPPIAPMTAAQETTTTKAT